MKPTQKPKTKPTKKPLARKKILGLIDEFLKLNERQEQSRFSAKERARWFELKRQLEWALFSRPPMETDARRTLRIEGLCIPASFTSGALAHAGEIREASEGGLFLATPEPVPVGAGVMLSLDVPEGFVHLPDSIELAARVVYTNVGSSMAERRFSGMGLAFTPAVNATARAAWCQLLQQILLQVAAAAPAKHPAA